MILKGEAETPDAQSAVFEFRYLLMTCEQTLYRSGPASRLPNRFRDAGEIKEVRESELPKRGE